MQSRINHLQFRKIIMITSHIFSSDLKAGEETALAGFARHKRSTWAKFKNEFFSGSEPEKLPQLNRHRKLAF